MIDWEILSQDENLISEFTAAGIDETVSRILVNRGCGSVSEAKAFLSSDVSGLCDPALLPDMEKAAEKIENALSENKKITVYGDYDVDGVTSTSLLYKYLKSRGGNVAYYIPDRKEGYGLSFQAVDKISADGTGLIVTVDTGTTAVEEVKYAKDAGLDIVVTDHHECAESLPDCPVVNPKRKDSGYPFPFLAGVGVVFKLVSFLSGEDITSLFEKYGYLAAVGTIADIMPLYGENRVIVKHGLSSFSKEENVGFSALIAAADCTSSDSSSVAFRIAPRLNAVGRMSSAKTAVELLLCEDEKKAADLAKILCEKNEERQSTEKRIFSSVEQRLGDEEKHNIIVEGDESWHNGVIGIVASRLVEKYRRPTVLFTFEGENCKGSARSLSGVGIYNIISACSENLERFGGHEMAAGLSLKKENFEKFREEIYGYADKNIDPRLFMRRVKTDCVLPHGKLTVATCKNLEALEPFGAGNPSPVFTVENLKIAAITGVSSDKHSRITFQKEDGGTFDAMFFSMPPLCLSAKKGDAVKIACSLSVNVFRGRQSLSVIIRAMSLCEDFGTEICKDEKITRKDVAAVFSLVRSVCQGEKTEISPLGLFRALRMKNPEMTYSKMVLSLEITEELGLLSFAEKSAAGVSEDVLFSVRLNSNTEKTSLEKSEIYRKHSN